MPDVDHQRTYDEFLARTLPKPQWTHEAHLAVCWHALRTRQPAEAIAFLRGAITAYNESVGTANTPTNGYHESLTRYYVGAVASVGASSPTELFQDPRCSRTAPPQHWSGNALRSPAARLGWVEPDVRPLPWLSTPAAHAHHTLVIAVAGELELLLPSVRANGLALEQLLHPDFVEVGASGRRWSRAEIIADLTTDPAGGVADIAVDDLGANRLDDGTTLVTYRCATSERSTWRSSIWVRTRTGWQMRYHQGTVTAPAT